MKIKYADATGCPMGQFVVTAESEQERAILASFMEAQYQKEWQFWIHGCTYYSDYYPGPNLTSFNFGWIKPRKLSLWQRVSFWLSRFKVRLPKIRIMIDEYN